MIERQLGKSGYKIRTNTASIDLIVHTQSISVMLRINDYKEVDQFVNDVLNSVLYPGDLDIITDALKYYQEMESYKNRNQKNIEKLLTLFERTGDNERSNTD